MRLLCTADLHYRLTQLDWLVEQAPSVDVMILPGDLLQVVGSAPLEVQIVVMKKYLERMAEHTVVLASSGNHDLDGPGPHGDQHAGWIREIGAPNLYVDGDSVDLPSGDGRSGGMADVRFTVCPWWDGPASRDGVDAQLATAAVDRPARWVWVYHSPPAGTRLCTTGSREYPDDDLAAWIDRYAPDAVICGHIHQAPWAPGGGWVDRRGSTLVFNAGHQSGDMPAHIELDLDARRAEWIALPDHDERDLDLLLSS